MSNEHLRKPRRLSYLSANETRRVSNIGAVTERRVKKVEPIAVEHGSKFKPLYKTTRWFKLRAEILKRDMYTCQLCGAVGEMAGKLVCYHVRGHPPDETEEMFWKGPFQTVCETCHNTVRAKEDNAMKKRWFVR